MVAQLKPVARETRPMPNLEYYVPTVPEAVTRTVPPSCRQLGNVTSFTVRTLGNLHGRLSRKAAVGPCLKKKKGRRTR